MEGVLSKEHKIKQDSQSPHIHKYTIRLFRYNLWRHIFLSAALGLSTNLADGPGKPKIGNLVENMIVTIKLKFFLLDENIFGFDIAMNEAVFVYVFKTF